MQKIKKTEQEWKAILSPDEFAVMREKGTEAPFTGKYNAHKAKGTYYCNGCKSALFNADTKYDSGSGWPSFTAPVSRQAIDEITDRSHGMLRTEVLCAQCDAHLGHVFTDGPTAEGLRYCINSVSLDFTETEK